MNEGLSFILLENFLFQSIQISSEPNLNSIFVFSAEFRVVEETVGSGIPPIKGLYKFINRFGLSIFSQWLNFLDKQHF
jgi:hypothetical protein